LDAPVGRSDQIADVRYWPAMRRLAVLLALALTSHGAALGQIDQPIAELLKPHQSISQPRARRCSRRKPERRPSS
jgi:hypothetical protein